MARREAAGYTAHRSNRPHGDLMPCLFDRSARIRLARCFVRLPLCIVSFLFAANALTAAVLEVTLVAATGMNAPGLAPGVTFAEFIGNPAFGSNGPRINEAGHVVFYATLQGPSITNTNRESLWSTAHGLHRVIQDAMPAPGFPAGITFTATSRDLATFDLAGRTAFTSYVVGPNVPLFSASGLWTEDNGTLTELLSTGDQAPGLPAGNQIEHVTWALTNDVGHHAAIATLAGTLITPNNRHAVYSDRSGTFQVVARAGAAAPGTGVAFGPFAFDDLSQDKQGRVAFLGFLQGGGVSEASDSGIWSGEPGGLRLVAREGQVAPGAGGATFRNPSVGTPFGHSVLNNLGRVAFHSQLFAAERSEGIWTDASGTLRPVVLRGQATGPVIANGSFSSVEQPVINDLNEVAFRAHVFEPGVGEVESVWKERAGQFELIARAGQEAPGAGGEFFLNIGEDNTSQVVMNNIGQVALEGRLAPSPDVTLANARGIWATDLEGMLQLIVREGDQIEVAPHDFRTIAIVQLFGTRGQLFEAPSMVGSGMNDFGQIAFHALFTDNSQGIFVTNAVTIPEPGGIGLAMVAVIAVCLVSWRTRKNVAREN